VGDCLREVHTPDVRNDLLRLLTRLPGAAPRTLRAFVTGTLAAALLVGCYGTTVPSYNPGDASQLVAAVTRRGVTVTATVSGDSACPDPELTGNALHLTVTDPAASVPRDVYVYIFRQKTWDASKAQVDACQAAYGSAHPGATIERLDIPIYRVLGADWSPGLRAAIQAAVTEASQAGTPP
jgi:hypothetical protein